MRVRILFFGQLKEVAGRERDTLELPEGARVADLLRRYAEVKPALKVYYDAMAVALNQEYSEAGAVLHEGDEVALIPPVSGGSGKKPAAQQDEPALHARSLGPNSPRDDALLRRADAGDHPSAPKAGALGTPGEGARATKVEIVWKK